jgi:hypothetical protein
MDKRLAAMGLAALVGGWGSGYADGGSMAKQAPDSNHLLFDPQAVKNDWGLWTTGSVLLWQANENDLDFAVKSSSRKTLKGHVINPDFNWDWGFRLGLGYKLPHDKWDLFLNYTYVHGNAHKQAGAGSGAIYGGYAVLFGLDVPKSSYAHSTHAHWNMNLNMADLELGRNCIIGKWLSIRPFLGVRGLVIQQHYNISYSGGNAFPHDEQKVSMRNDFWGVGLRMGFNSLWGLGCGFSVFGNGAASLLAGQFDIRQRNHMEHKNVDLVHITDDGHQNVVATAEIALGLQWDRFFCNDRYHFGVNLGWEFNAFFDQNQWMRFSSTRNPGVYSRSNGDLTFQGVTLGLRFDF